ncbi:MAG: hypothetical protein LW875_04970 [Proteobacteria bacterium]|jgi:hypothetical protein|nr:hypothetical protein [Pseudomonadota bacterium]
MNKNMILLSGLVVFAVSGQAFAKSKLNVSEFNTIIEETNKAARELREKIADYAGVVRTPTEKGPSVDREKLRKELDVEQVAVTSEGVESFLDKKETESPRTKVDFNRISQEVKDAGNNQ